MNAACKKWVAIVFTVVLAENVYGFPTYFAERIYRTWEQLDEALAAGEITPDVYDETDYQEPSESDPNLVDSESSDTVSYSPSGIRYYSRFVQDLDQTQRWKRRDTFAVRRKQYSLGVEFEKGLDGTHFLRSFSFSMKGSGWRISAGDFRPGYGRSLTIGGTNSQSELHRKSDLGKNLIYPYANRENGLMLNYSARDLKISGFVSRLRGPSHCRESSGVDFALSRWTNSVESVGLTCLRQKVGQIDGNSRTFTYLAPHFQFQFKPWTVTGESSFQINGAQAHNYELDSRSEHWSQSYLLFSYARDYQNLESGGYAYSDYEDETIDDIEFTYRDKRAGRQGVAIEQSYRDYRVGSFATQLVRWANRNDDRQCLAARLSHAYAHGSKAKKYFAIKTQAIWQDLDIVGRTDLRRLVTINPEWGVSYMLTYECLLKIEQRILNSGRRYPFRLRNDLTFRVSPSLSLLTTVNFYNSDISSSNKSQLTLAIGQRISAADNFGLTTRLQTRYCLATGRCDNWEMRINLDLIL